MKVFGLHFLKNFVFFILKLVLISLFCLQCTSLGVSYYNNIKTEYHNYADLRGKANWMTDGVAQLVEEDDNFGTYSYIVEDTEYSFTVDKKDVAVIDKTVKIVYDSNEPKIVVNQYELSKIDGFYTNSFKLVCFYYVEIFALVIILGLAWFLLDYIKYNKGLWGLYV